MESLVPVIKMSSLIFSVPNVCSAGDYSTSKPASWGVFERQ